MFTIQDKISMVINILPPANCVNVVKRVKINKILREQLLYK